MSTPDPLNPFGGWDDTPYVWVSDVIRRWTRALCAERPWVEMSRDDIHGMMRPILSELLNEARDIDDVGRRRRLAIAAHEHGVFRSMQRCTEHDLVTEFAIVRESVEETLRQGGTDGWAIRDTMCALDRDFGAAKHGAMRGWHCTGARWNLTIGDTLGGPLEGPD